MELVNRSKGTKYARQWCFRIKAFKLLYVLNLEFRKCRTIKRDHRILGYLWTKCSKHQIQTPHTTPSLTSQQITVFHTSAVRLARQCRAMVRQCRAYAAVPRVSAAVPHLIVPLGPWGYKYPFYPSPTVTWLTFFFLPTRTARRPPFALSLTSIEAP